MQLRIENIGPIGSAVVELTGLTVIGGLNDTGKSTIGKVYFSIIKAIQNKEQEYANAQRNRVNAIVSELTSDLRKVYGARINPTSLQSAIRIVSELIVPIESLTPDTIEKGLVSFRNQVLNEINRKIYRGVAEEQLENLIQEEENGIIDVIGICVSKLRALLVNEKESKNVYSESFSNIIHSVFRGEVNNKRSSEKGKIVLNENEKEVFSAVFERNQLISFDIDESAISDFFNDATILESPIVLNYSNLSLIFGDSPNNFYFVDYPASDLLRKIRFASNTNSIIPTAGEGLEAEISSMIANAINGTISFDSKQGDFVYSTDGIQVKISNTASGVKSLGIMQMLAGAGFFSDNPLFIVDEPEVHLHPAWQLVCANIIATLVAKYNVYCLVSSHSPYFIQAIEAYTKLYKAQGLTKFYLSSKEKSSGLCNVKEVTNDLEPIYDLLAEPMEKIVFLQTKSPISPHGQTH